MKARNFATGFMNMEDRLLEFDFYISTVFLRLTCSVVVQRAICHEEMPHILEWKILPSLFYTKEDVYHLVPYHFPAASSPSLQSRYATAKLTSVNSTVFLDVAEFNSEETRRFGEM
jgi:hypothetical protein